ncbi:MAG: HAD family hydrolase [Treponema sp.]|nr:HAD family hydrolase [Treponema sp.]
MFDYYFFDLDGTLTNPALGITNSFKYAFKELGLEIPSYEKLCTFIGPPLVTTFKTHCGFNDEEAKVAVKKYREYFARKGLLENEVIEGIPQLLEELQNCGKHLFVATSKPEEYSVRILEHFDLAKYFEHICGSNMDETRSKKSEVIDYAWHTAGKPDKSKVIMIGDREHDIIGAKENGVKSCGVLFGFGNRQEFQAAGADFIAEKVGDILKIF